MRCMHGTCALRGEMFEKVVAQRGSSGSSLDRLVTGE